MLAKSLKTQAGIHRLSLLAMRGGRVVPFQPTPLHIGTSAAEQWLSRTYPIRFSLMSVDPVSIILPPLDETA
jgi:hypothetical protein